MPCKPGVAGSIPGFSIKPLSVSLRVLPSYNKHTNHKPSRRYWLLPRESHKKFLENKLFISGKGTVVKYRKGYDRSEKRHGARENGMAQGKHYDHVITCQVSHQK